jgi:hypothetical protein
MSMALNTPIEPQFRTIDGLKIRFAESEPAINATTPVPVGSLGDT